MTVAAGTYTVRVLTTPPVVFEKVRLLGEDRVELRVSDEKRSV